MRWNSPQKWVIVAIWALLVCQGPALAAGLKVPELFGEHMVLQRQRPVPVWGWGDAGQSVTVTLAGQSHQTTVRADGTWRVDLDAMDAGGPYEMVITATEPDGEICLGDVLVGEVWLCSGQSNMAWIVKNVNNADEEIAGAVYPRLRHFKVELTTASEPKANCQGSWAVCSPQTVEWFTAVGYFFGRYLHQELDVPIGLINSSWGGTLAEAWTSGPGLMRYEDALRPILDRFEAAMRAYPERLKLYEQQKAEHDQRVKEGKTLPQVHADPGNKGQQLGWHQADFDDSAWPQTQLPATLETFLGTDFDGAAWFRKRVTLPESWVGKELIVSLGGIDDFDVTYFNGRPIGSTGIDVPSFWTARRVYTVPAALVQGPEALLAVRVFDHYGESMFHGPAKLMQLSLAENEADTPVSAAGPWRYAVEVKLSPAAICGPGNSGPTPPMGADSPNAPSRLYNAMIHPLIPYALRGAIWYQGESNASRAHQYRTLMPALIEDWRRAWGQGAFPFYMVQLANFMAVKPEPSQSAWAELREAQTMTLSLENTGMACIIDIGEAGDIHPRNKQDVGKRLALWALAKDYGMAVVYSGPLYRAMDRRGDAICVSFDHVGGGLTVHGDTLSGFAIAGADKQFVWAQATLEGDTVLVRSGAVAEPVAVRYGWADNPECNLYNKEGLPAVPFRTDAWPGLTHGQK